MFLAVIFKVKLLKFVFAAFSLPAGNISIFTFIIGQGHFHIEYHANCNRYVKQDYYFTNIGKAVDITMLTHEDNINWAWLYLRGLTSPYRSPYHPIFVLLFRRPTIVWYQSTNRQRLMVQTNIKIDCAARRAASTIRWNAYDIMYTRLAACNIRTYNAARWNQRSRTGESDSLCKAST